MSLRDLGIILLVDDEVSLRKLVRRVLIRQGYTVFEAADAGAAELLFEEHGASIDLLLTDVTMPGMNGLELARKLLAIRPAMKVLFMTGYDDGALLATAVEAPLLRKPFTPETLSSRIRTSLGHAS